MRSPAEATEIRCMEPAARLLPSRATLAAFLRERRPQSMAAVAELIGLTRGELRRVMRAFPSPVTIRWEDAALWLLEAWPLEVLVAQLGPDAALLPEELHPQAFGVALPAYVIRALETQWKIECLPHRLMQPATFTAYLWDLLHRAIDPMTVSALRHDVEFLRAYDFPETPGHE